MSKKLGKLVSVIVLMFPLLAGFFMTEVNAAEVENVTVNLHKRVFENGDSKKDPYAKQNTGEEMPDFGGEALNGVTFEVYDVSEEFIRLLESESAEAATATILKDTEAAHYAPEYASRVSEQKTAGEGVATFANLPIKKDGKYATYLFVETNSPGTIKEKAAPIVLTMPIYIGETNDINTNVHIYPKNEKESMLEKDLTEDSKKDLKVTINGEEIYNVEKGQRFSYNISALLPWNISDKDFYHITDTPNEGMQVVLDTVSVKGLDKETDFVVVPDESGRGYILKLDTKSDKVAKLAGERLVITYDAYLTEAALVDTGINNEASVIVGNNIVPSEPGNPGDPEDPTDPEEPPVEGPDVFTGGKKFQKVDDKSGKTLANAKFNLVKLDATGEVISYATYKDGKYTWNATKEEATSYESNDAGEIVITGLEYSEKLEAGESYAIVEYEAPEGYALLENPVKFDVVKDKFDTEVLAVKNIKKGLLPSTGGNGIYMFLVAGSILMAGAFVWYRRTQVTAEV